MTYTVRAGQSLLDITIQHVGRTGALPELLAANAGFAHDTRLATGQTIQLPSTWSAPFDPATGAAQLRAQLARRAIVVTTGGTGTLFNGVEPNPPASGAFAPDFSEEFD
jgi:hypothetical protein